MEGYALEKRGADEIHVQFLQDTNDIVQLYLHGSLIYLDNANKAKLSGLFVKLSGKPMVKLTLLGQLRRKLTPGKPRRCPFYILLLLAERKIHYALLKDRIFVSGIVRFTISQRYARLNPCLAARLVPWSTFRCPPGFWG